LALSAVVALGGSAGYSGAGDGEQKANSWKVAFELGRFGTPVTGPASGRYHVFVVSADGSDRHGTTLPGLPSPSPNGRRLAFAIENGEPSSL
jgi:hypothetical protein